MGAARSVGLSGRPRRLRVGDAPAAGPHVTRRDGSRRRADVRDADDALKLERTLMKRWLVIALVVIFVIVDRAAGTVAAQSGAGNGEWRTYGGDTGNTRYAPLDQINASNFNSL